jgi:hypothetical protein
MKRVGFILLLVGCKLLHRGGDDKDKDFPVDTTTPPPTVAATAPSLDPAASAVPSAVASALDIVDAAAIDPRIAARNQALHEAAEFGMIGIIGDASDTAPWGPGGTIGLGNIGTLGGSRLTAGDAGRTRSASIRQGAITVNGRLPPEVIQRIVRQNFGRFRLCYENGLRSNPALQGRVSVTFVIARDGSISSAKDGGSDLPDTGVVQCVVRGFGNLSFPQPEAGIVTVTFPLIFNPS